MVSTILDGAGNMGMQRCTVQFYKAIFTLQSGPEWEMLDRGARFKSMLGQNCAYWPEGIVSKTKRILVIILNSRR